MSVYLDVPYASQLNYGGGRNDPTGCWYCSCCMIAWFFEAGPRLGVPRLWGPDGHLPVGGPAATERLKSGGIDTNSGGFDIMAKNERLEPVPNLATDRSLAELETLLRENGPIYFGWTKMGFAGLYGHASVLIGTDDSVGGIIYHDPENEPNARAPLDGYNRARMRGYYSMMRRIGVTSSLVRVGTAPTT
jgi:hypothetical protein